MILTTGGLSLKIVRTIDIQTKKQTHSYTSMMQYKHLERAVQTSPQLVLFEWSVASGVLEAMYDCHVFYSSFFAVWLQA